MSEVKSLKVTTDTYRHRGWMWRNRATYELFKPYMKIPLWVDRLLANSDTSQYFIVGDKDGDNNAMYVGDATRPRFKFPPTQPERMAYNCNTKPQNGFVVLAERIRAKKPDANKTPRPLWRQPLHKPWAPVQLDGDWLVDSNLVKAVSFTSQPPAWADRLWVSTSAGNDTFVWVNSDVKRSAPRGEVHDAVQAKGITGSQTQGNFALDEVLCSSSCHWQLAGVRKKTVWVPEPEVVKPSPDKPVTATEVREAQREMERVPSLSDLICAPYGHDVYSRIAQELNITRAAAKERMFREAYRPGALGVPAFSLVDFAELERRAAAHFAPQPPVGVKPRNLHDEERANALDEAMVRYLNADLPFPTEWAVEWNELRARLNKEQK